MAACLLSLLGYANVKKAVEHGTSSMNSGGALFSSPWIFGERHHQGLANRLISPEAGHLGNAGVVQRRQLLGGMLNYYYRATA